MSDTNTDTNDDAIKKKKNQSAGKTDVGGFIQNFALSMVGIILFIVFGTSWLYIAKLSTAKIIPLDTYFEPYTCEKNVDLGKDKDIEIKVPMNTMSELDFKGLKFWGEPIGKWEQEATFSPQGFIKSFNHSFINTLRKKTDNPASSSNYDKFKSILINNIVGTGFMLYDKISIPDGIRMMPDSLKIVIYGLFGLMFFPFFWIWNGAASFYYTIMTLSKGEASTTENPNDGGYDGGLFDGVDALKNGDSLLYNFGKACLRFFVWIPIWLIVIPVLSMFVFPAIGTFYPFFKMLFSAGYKLKEYDPFTSEKKSNSKSFLDFVKDNLVYKRTLILVFAILNLFTCANKYLGEKYFTAVVIATIFGVIFGNILVNSEPDDATMISVKETVEPVHEKPDPLDDECEEYQAEVIDAWKKLKQENERVDELINDYPDYSQKGELKRMKKHMIEEFKKLDGKQPLKNTMVTNYDIASPDNTISYTRLYSEYTNFIKECQTEAREEQALKDQVAKEEGEKAQAAAAAQVEADRVAAEARNAKIEADRIAADTTATISSSTNNNNNSSNKTATATGIATRPEPLIEKTDYFTQPNPLANPKRGMKKKLDTIPMTDTGNNNSSSSATGGGSSANVPMSNSSVATIDTGNNSSSSAAVQSNIAESPVPVKIEENRPSSTSLAEDTSKEGRAAVNPPGDKEIGKIGKEKVNDFISARTSDVTSSSSSSGGGSSGGSNVGDSTSAILLNNVLHDNPELVKNALSLLNQKEITEILELYRKELANISTNEDKIVNIKKYLPMIIEKHRQLNGEQQPLPEDEMKAYIRQNFPTAAETGVELGNAISKLDDEELARYKAAKTAKTGGGSSNPLVSSNQIKQPPANKVQELARNKVMTAIMLKKPFNDLKTYPQYYTKLDMLDQANLDYLINQATERFVKGKGPIELKRNEPLYDNIKQLLTEKYKANVGGTQVVDELNKISAQQADGSYTLTGGSKNKQKTLKNRRQRFNIRLV